MNNISGNKLLLLQSIGVTLQVVNAGLGTTVHNPAMSVMVGAIVAGYQFFIQHLGNQAIPTGATCVTDGVIGSSK